MFHRGEGLRRIFPQVPQDCGLNIYCGTKFCPVLSRQVLRSRCAFLGCLYFGTRKVPRGPARGMKEFFWDAALSGNRQGRVSFTEFVLRFSKIGRRWRNLIADQSGVNDQKLQHIWIVSPRWHGISLIVKILQTPLSRLYGSNTLLAWPPSPSG